MSQSGGEGGRAEQTASSRVQRKREERVQEIVRAAADLFGEHGYDAVNLEDVAAVLDVTKGSLYYYFSSKSELGTAAIETLGNDWVDRLEALSADLDDDPVEQLHTLIREHVRIAVCEYPAALGLFLVPRDWPDEQGARVKALRRRHDLLFRSAIERGVDRGEFSVASVDVTMQCLHAAMSQAPRWCARLGRRRQLEAIDELSDTLMQLVVACRSLAS